MNKDVYNKSVCMGDTTHITAPSRGLSGSVNLTVRVKCVPDQPMVPWQRKFENFYRRSAITRLTQICPRFDQFITCISQVIANFLLQFLNFRYRGNKGWSEANFTAAIKLPNPQNPVFGARIGDIYPTQAEL